jgi:hypothetical protein
MAVCVGVVYSEEAGLILDANKKKG